MYQIQIVSSRAEEEDNIYLILLNDLGKSYQDQFLTESCAFSHRNRFLELLYIEKYCKMKLLKNQNSPKYFTYFI